MSGLILVRPDKSMKEAIWDYRQEFFDNGEYHVNGSFGLHRYDDINTWLEDIRALEKDKLNGDGVHASTFVSVRESDNRVIGTIQLRHELTPSLIEDGGSIGYAVRPSERGKGYGRAQLKLVLGIAKDMGIDKVLITCDKDNIASRNTALSCGGYSYDGATDEKFWIDTVNISHES